MLQGINYKYLGDVIKQKGRKDKTSCSKKEGSAFDSRCFHNYFFLLHGDVYQQSES